MKVKILTTLAAVVAAVVVSAPRASADPMLELISGATTTTIPGSGGTAYYEGSFAGWLITIDSGAASGNDLDLSAAAIAGVTPGALTILFSSGGYSGLTSATASVTGLNAPTGITFDTYYGVAPFSEANVLTTGLTGTGVLPSGGPYYVTEAVTFGAGSLGDTDLADANLAVPDGGMTAILLGGAMTAMTLIRFKVTKLT